MQRDFLKIVFVVLLAFLSLGVASAQGPKEQSKPSQTAKTGSHHHSSSKPKDSNKASPTAESGREEERKHDLSLPTQEIHSTGATGVEKGYRWVDLGLSVKWATCNVGANSPEEYGDYFAWGETDPKSNYTWETYKFRTSGDSWNNVKFSKYNTMSSFGHIDNITELQLGDDVACAKWGGNWRMPTYAEFEELLDNCEKEWTTYNGVKGYKFTSKKNGKSIFLPAAGSRDGTDPYGAGTRGRYWSSSLFTVRPSYAEYLIFNSVNVNTNYYYRHYGLSVRPVSE